MPVVQGESRIARSGKGRRVMNAREARRRRHQGLLDSPRCAEPAELVAKVIAIFADHGRAELFAGPIRDAGIIATLRLLNCENQDEAETIRLARLRPGAVTRWCRRHKTEVAKMLTETRANSPTA